MASPYEGLMEHAERFLGPQTHAEPPDFLGYDRGFAVGFFRNSEHDMVSAASSGLRSQDLEFAFPEEIVCSARPGQEEEAGYLVHVAAEAAIENGKGHGYGGGYRNAELLIPESQISGFAYFLHPLLPTEFNYFRNADGTAVLRFVTLVPVAEPEFRFIQDEGFNKMIEVWRGNATDNFDLYRESAV